MQEWHGGSTVLRQQPTSAKTHHRAESISSAVSGALRLDASAHIGHPMLHCSLRLFSTGLHFLLLGVHPGHHPFFVAFHLGQHFESLISFRLASVMVWLVFISASRLAIICSISIVWRYSFLLQSPIQPLRHDPLQFPIQLLLT